MDAGMRQDFRDVFDAHDAALRALRDANAALTVADEAQKTAFRAHDAAIQKALDATHAALSLFDRRTGGDQS
jgi:hypothetical protein